MTAPLAAGIDAIPYVSTTAERNARYPAPARNQRVQNGQTGALERWTGAAWATDSAFATVPSGVTVGLSAYLANSRVYNVKDYGAKGDGVTDDGAAVDAANAAATAAGGVVLFPDTGLPYVLGRSFDVDMSRVSWVGTGRAELFWTASSGVSTHVLRLFCSTTAGQEFYNGLNAIHGLRLGSTKNGPLYGIRLGHPTFTQNSQIVISQCTIARFTRCIEMIANAWRCRFENCFIGDTPDAGGNLIWFGASLSNAGECFTFDHCKLANGGLTASTVGTIAINGPSQWDFRGCSLLNARLVVSAEADVLWEGGNIENPGNAINGYRMIEVNDFGRVDLVGARVVINDPSLAGGASWQMPPFFVSDDARGLFFHGCNLRGGSYLLTEVDGGERVMVKTTNGRVHADGITPWGKPSTWGPQQVLALANGPANRLRNGGFDDATLAPWATVTTGTGGSAARSAAALRNGSFGARLTLTGGGAGTVSLNQVMRVEPARLVSIHVWARCSTASVLAAPQLVFLDVAGNVISTQVLQTTASTTYVILLDHKIVPAGADTVRLELVASTASAAGTVDYDAVIGNVH